MSDLVFILLRTALFGKALDENPPIIISQNDWNNLFLFFQQQGLSSVVIDSIGKIPLESKPDKPLIRNWMAVCLNSERRWKKQFQTIDQLANTFQENGVKTLLLKGLGASLYYPNPFYRESGDIDIYLFGESEVGNKIAEKQLGAKIEKFNKKEDHIFYNGFSIDNHINFMWIGNRYDRIFNERLIELLQERELESFHGTAAFLPPPEFNYLFLLKHSRDHFMRNEMSLRQVTDVALFLKKEGNRIDWERIEHILVEGKIKKYSDAILAFIKFYFDIDIHVSLVDKRLAERIKNDIFFNSHPVVYHATNISQKLYTLKMIWKNRWKYNSLYDGGIVSYLIDKIRK